MATIPYLKAWLPFDESATQDRCGNSWETFGNPYVGTSHAFRRSALQLDGSSYIKLSNIELGGQDFQIDGWAYIDSSSPSYARLVHIQNSQGFAMISVRKNKDDSTKLDFWANSTADVSEDRGYTYVSDTNCIGERIHWKLIYRYSDKRISFCINDKIVADQLASKNRAAVQYKRQSFDIYIGGYSSQRVIGAIDEVRIYDGTWFSYNKSDPPTLNTYIALGLTLDGQESISFNLDLERKIRNALTTWRYENLGDADDLIIPATILTNLPATQSATGTAFYQTTRAKCFDLPPTSEIWIKFDVFFDGSNRWRAYNEGSAGSCGICSYQSSTKVGLWCNDVNISYFSDIIKTNTLQTVLLHMISGATDGIVEAWVAGQFIYRYTGDVNHDEDFADIYLQSDGEGTFFSSVVISNAELKPSVWNQLKVWLPFNNSTIEDKCINKWSAYGSPTTGSTHAVSERALQLNGSNYLKLNEITLGGQDFTVDGFAYMNSSSGNLAEIFYIGTGNGLLMVLCRDDETPNNLQFWVGQNATVKDNKGYSTSSSVAVVGKRVHFELVYQYFARTTTLYIDGVQAGQRTNCPQYTRAKFSVWIGDRKFIGAIDEFRIFDGIALHTANFTPPTADSYFLIQTSPKPINVSTDFVRKLKNKVRVIFDVERNTQIDNNSDSDSDSDSDADSDSDSDGAVINLCVRYNGSILKIPLTDKYLPLPCLVVFYKGQEWRNELVSPGDPRASSVHLWHKNAEFALSTKIRRG